MIEKRMQIDVLSVPKRPRLDGLQEGLRVEFKTSLFFSAGKDPQVQVIARTIASFMNAQGGDLYIGVDDCGNVVGLDGDRRALMLCDLRTFVKHGDFDDSAWDYTKATLDAFQRKINAIVRCYLGVSALKYISEVVEECVEGVSYLRVSISKATEDVVILFRAGKWTELWVRGNGQKNQYKDIDRDAFIAGRARDIQAQLAERHLLQMQKDHGDELLRLGEIHRRELERIDTAHKQESIRRDEELKRVFEEINSKLGDIGKHDKDDHANVDERGDNGDHAQAVAKLMKILGDAHKKAGENRKVDSGHIACKQREDRIAKIADALRAAASRVRADQQDDGRNRVFEHDYDSMTITTEVMDKFEERRGGVCVYSRLELKKCGEGLDFIPYEHKWEGDCCTNGYVKVAEVDFKIAELVLIIRRCNKETKDLGGGFSFSDLKKGYTGSLASSIWESVTPDVCQKPDGNKCEIMLKNPLLFRAHTSDSFSSRRVGDPNRYEIFGVRFVKQKLLFCPKYLSDDEHREFLARNLLLALKEKMSFMARELK